MNLCLYREFQSVTGFHPKLPQRATAHSAGYDFKLLDTVTILPGSIVTVPTGVKCLMPDDEFLGLYIRSSLGRRGLELATGVSIIDADYYENPDNEGHILIMLRNTSSTAITLQAGDRVVQGIFQKYMRTNNDKAIARRSGGVGSTGESS